MFLLRWDWEKRAGEDNGHFTFMSVLLGEFAGARHQSEL